MVTFTHLLTASLASFALATPITPTLDTRQTTIPSNWTWHVSGSEMGCTRSGCYYHFNVTVPAIEGYVSGVKAYCTGNENGWYRKGNWYEGCQILEGVNNGVAAKLSERESDVDGFPKEIEISFVKAGYMERPAYNFTGSHATIYNAFVQPTQEFDVTPTAVFAVA
jgi:hypothetical protein